MLGAGGKLNDHLMASCVRNIRTKYYQNLIIGFQVTVKNVGDVFVETQFVNTLFLLTAMPTTFLAHLIPICVGYLAHVFGMF